MEIEISDVSDKAVEEDGSELFWLGVFVFSFKNSCHFCYIFNTYTSHSLCM